MTSEQKIPYRPLALLTSVVEQAGFEVTYFYEDLVFIEHNAFLLRMEEEPSRVSLFFNTLAKQEMHDEIFKKLSEAAEVNGFQVVKGGSYRLIPNEEDQLLELAFEELTD